MRVSTAQLHRTRTEQIQRRAADAARAERAASSGERIERASDDPVGAARAVRVRAAQAQVDASRALAARASRDLERQEQTIGSMTSLLSRARELAVQLANPIVGAGTRSAGAVEIAEIRAGVLALANTRLEGRALFGGSQTGADAFDAAGVYQGDAVATSVSLGAGATVQTTTAGDGLLAGAAGGPDILASLDALQTAMASDDEAGIRGELDRLGLGTDWLAQQRGTVGARMRTAEAVDAHLEDVQVQLADARSELEDADVAATYTELVRARSAYQAALQVTAAARVDDVFGLLGL